MLKCWLSKVRRGAVLHRENQINEVSALSEEIGISSEGNRVRGRKQKHHQTMIDMKMTKITPGFVSQVYNTETDRFTSQKFVAKDGEVEFARDAVISEGEENGAYVQCWQWVSFVGHPALDKESATERKHRS